MRTRQVLITRPQAAEMCEIDLPDPAANQILFVTYFSAVSAGTELAVWTGTHQWLFDPRMPEWKFPFRPGYSAARVVAKVGSGVVGWKEGDRVSYPGNHAAAELLTLGQERGRLWKLPDGLPFDRAAWACIARYGLGGAIRCGLTLGRSVAVLGLGVIGQFALRSMVAAGACPVVGIDAVAMRRRAALVGGADLTIDPTVGDLSEQLWEAIGTASVEVVLDCTGVSTAVPEAMALACDAGQVVVVGSPRGRVNNVNFYDHLHRRYLEVTGAHGNMLFEPAHCRLAGDWNLDKAQHWLLHALANHRLRLDGLVSHVIAPDALISAYDGLLLDKECYLGVLVHWTSD
jgi:2-desacetyl-2-hydroxyethyl bacteriochlorophyllide A dehydrogenase